MNYTYISNQANLLKAELFCKQITLNLTIFDGSQHNFREKNYIYGY